MPGKAEVLSSLHKQVWALAFLSCPRSPALGAPWPKVFTNSDLSPAAHRTRRIPAPLRGFLLPYPALEPGECRTVPALPSAAAAGKGSCPHPSPSRGSRDPPLDQPPPETQQNPAHGWELVILILVLFAEEGASFAVGALLRRQNTDPAVAANHSPSPLVSVQLVLVQLVSVLTGLCLTGLPSWARPCPIFSLRAAPPGTRTEKGCAKVTFYTLSYSNRSSGGVCGVGWEWLLIG